MYCVSLPTLIRDLISWGRTVRCVTLILSRMIFIPICTAASVPEYNQLREEARFENLTVGSGFHCSKELFIYFSNPIVATDLMPFQIFLVSHQKYISLMFSEVLVEVLPVSALSLDSDMALLHFRSQH